MFNETPPIRVQRISVQKGLVMQRPGVEEERTHGEINRVGGKLQGGPLKRPEERKWRKKGQKIDCKSRLKKQDDTEHKMLLIFRRKKTERSFCQRTHDQSKHRRPPLTPPD